MFKLRSINVMLLQIIFAQCGVISKNDLVLSFSIYTSCKIQTFRQEQTMTYLLVNIKIQITKVLSLYNLTICNAFQQYWNKRHRFRDIPDVNTLLTLFKNVVQKEKDKISKLTFFRLLIYYQGKHFPEKQLFQSALFLRNEILKIVLENSKFLVQIQIQSLMHLEKIHQKNVVIKQTVPLAQCKFLKKLHFNGCIAIPEFQQLTLNPFQFLKVLKFNDCNNRKLQFLSKANWPRLKSLQIDAQHTADGIKYLRKYSVYTLQQIMSTAKFESEIARHFLKVLSLKRFYLRSKFHFDSLSSNVRISEAVFQMELAKGGKVVRRQPNEPARVVRNLISGCHSQINTV